MQNLIMLLIAGLLAQRGPVPLFIQPSSEIVIDVDDFRPLAAAADKLERQYGVAIDYEDIAWENDKDTLAARQRGSGRQLNIRMQMAGARPLDTPAEVLARTVQQHKAKGNPGEFRVLQVNARRFELLPSAAKNKAGQLRATHSPLDTLVTFPKQERTLMEAVSLVLASIDGVAGLGSAPLNLFSNSKVTVGAEAEPARDVLHRIFDETEPGDKSFPMLSWRLFGGSGPYIMNIRAVTREVVSPRTGETQLQAVPRLEPKPDTVQGGSTVGAPPVAGQDKPRPLGPPPTRTSDRPIPPPSVSPDEISGGKK